MPLSNVAMYTKQLQLYHVSCRTTVIVMYTMKPQNTTKVTDLRKGIYKYKIERRESILQHYSTLYIPLRRLVILVVFCGFMVYMTIIVVLHTQVDLQLLRGVD